MTARLKQIFRNHLLEISVLAVFVLQTSILSITMSVNHDEVGHLGAGLYGYDFHRCDVYRVNPPLVRSIAALPVYSMNPERDYSAYAEGPGTRVEWDLGRLLVATNSPRWEWYFVFARWAVIPVALAGAWCVARWSDELYGEVKKSDEKLDHGISRCAVLSLVLYCFCPNIVTWSATICPDAAASATGAIAAYAFWKWLRQPNWRRSFLAGICLGIAQLSKLSWIILIPLWPCLWAIWRLTSRHDDGLKSASFTQLMLIFLLAGYTINLGYGFEETMTPIKDITFVSRALAGSDSMVDLKTGGNRFRESWLGNIPIPLPVNFIRGIDLQKFDFERGKHSYMNGQWSEKGWWYFYLYAAGIKVPIGTLLLVAFVIVSRLYCWGASRSNSGVVQPESITWRDEFVLLATPVVLFIVVSAQTGFTIYFRYVLPCLPFAYIWLGQAVAGTWGHGADRSLASKQRHLCVVCGCAVWSVCSSLAVFPHSMSYFNELVDGPVQGHQHLLHSNIDWGQDYYYLRNWLRNHPEATPLYSAPNSVIPLKEYGIEIKTPYELPMPGWFAISVQRIHDMSGRFLFFLKYRPVARVGYSINIYHVSLDEANRVRRESGWREIPPDGDLQSFE
ncbi:MAG: glycosyltransferase family 39 protein [Planctomycetaceae bacterium]